MKANKRVTAIIERGLDGKYSVYIQSKSYPYGIIGTGDSAKEALDDFFEGYREMKDYVESTGEAFVEAEFVFKYDVPSFLQEFAFAFSLAGLERITGINQKQLGHYISGYRRPSKRTALRIESGIHSFSEQLSKVQFV
ncbi:MAG: DNA-binding protein [Bacteroidales bacterium]|nr:DNA-binding protein [Bacteroidales bacterium]